MTYLLTEEEYATLKNAETVAKEKAVERLKAHLSQQLPLVSRELGYGPGPQGYVVQLTALRKILDDFK